MGETLDAGAEPPTVAQAPRYGPPRYGPPRYGPPQYGPPTGDEGSSSPAIAGWASNLSTFLPMAGGFLIMGASPERQNGDYIATGITMVSLAAVLGPSIGHFYAGEIGHGFGFAGLRLLCFGSSVGLSMLGVFAAFGDSDATAAAPLLALAGVSGSVGLGLMLYDLIDAADAARRSNREEAAARRYAMPEITVTPMGGALTWSF